MSQPYWKTKELEDMNPEEWESLCDRCGRCCLLKLMDEDTEEVHYTDVACRLYDDDKCQCQDYHNREKTVADCVVLTPAEVRTLTWLPTTCAYRLIQEGKDLYPWHHLVSGDDNSVHEAGISTRGRVAGREGNFTITELTKRLRSWPNELPKKKRGSKER